MADIFISYTSTDKNWAFWIAKELEALGHTPHIHEFEVNAGDDIYKWMEERHDAADHVLCVKESPMRTHRFGRKIKLPATIAIKHQIRLRMAQYEAQKAEAEVSAQAISRTIQRRSACKVISTDFVHLYRPAAAKRR